MAAKRSYCGKADVFDIWHKVYVCRCAKREHTSAALLLWRAQYLFVHIWTRSQAAAGCVRHCSAWVGGWLAAIGVRRAARGVTAVDGAEFGCAHDVRDATKRLTKAYNGAEGICQASSSSSSSSTSMVGFCLCEMS